jgi:hypothetical protein
MMQNLQQKLHKLRQQYSTQKLPLKNRVKLMKLLAYLLIYIEVKLMLLQPQRRKRKYQQREDVVQKKVVPGGENPRALNGYKLAAIGRLSAVDVFSYMSLPVPFHIRCDVPLTPCIHLQRCLDSPIPRKFPYNDE